MIKSWSKIQAERNDFDFKKMCAETLPWVPDELRGLNF